MITNCKKGVMGTIEFMGQFRKMRKAQDFIVYHKDESGPNVQIQSDTRFGQVNLDTGELVLSSARSGGSNAWFLIADIKGGKATIETIPADELKMFREAIKSTGGMAVGSCGVVADNTGALEL